MPLYQAVPTKKFSMILFLACALLLTATVALAQTPTPDGPTVNVTASQQTIVVVPTPNPNNPNAVAFYVTDDRETAKQGDTLTYRIVVRNQRDKDLTQVKIVAFVPDYLVPQATSPAADAKPEARTLTWNNVTISNKAELTFAIRARVAPNTPNGTTLRLVAEINGPGVRGSASDSTRIEGNEARITPQAAQTTAPVAAKPVYRPAPVRPTAPTGADTGIVMSVVSLSLGSFGSWRLLKTRADA